MYICRHSSILLFFLSFTYITYMFISICGREIAYVVGVFKKKIATTCQHVAS